MTTPISRAEDGVKVKTGALLLALVLSACSDDATCTRKNDGVVMHGYALADADGITRYIVRDQNGIVSQVDASNSNDFVCKVLS